MPFKKWDPLQDLIMLHQDLFGERSQAGMDEPPRAAWSPAMDIYETPDNFVLKVEIPGIDPDKVKLECKDEKLILSGERPARDKQQVKKYHQLERVYGPFQRVIAMPPHVCFKDVEANYQDGVIEIVVMKKQADGARAIKVQS